MPRFFHHLDRLIDVGLVAVLCFTPLAFGSVEEWARAVGQAGIWCVFALWIAKTAWTAPVTRARRAAKSSFAGRVRWTGLEGPVLLFTAVLVLQLVPMPPRLVQLVSPKTAAIFDEALPGYGQPGPGTFSTLPEWLQQDPEAKAGDVPALPPDPQAAAAALPREAFDVPYRKWRPLSLTPADTRRALEVFLAHVALFFVAFNQIDRKRGAARYAMAIAVLAAALAGIGILQSLTADGKLYWWRGGGPQHSFGPFVNANNFAGWMEMALPLAGGLCLALRGGRRGEGGSPALTLLFAFTTVLGLAAFVLAMSRGGFLALLGAGLVAVGVYAARGRLNGKALALALVPVVLALGLAAWIDLPSIAERYGTIADLQEERSFRTRLDFSARALRMAGDFPVLGTGLGTFREAHYLYTPGTSSQELVRAHDDYAQVAAECGFVGLAAMLWAAWIVLRRGVIGGLLRRAGPARYVVRGAAIGALALMLHSFADFNLQIYSNSLLFVFLCAVLMRDASDAENAPGETAP